MTTEPETAPAGANNDHLRYEISQLEKMREQILADMEVFRQQETNLRTLETRLRDTMPPQGWASVPPVVAIDPRGPELDAEWEKFQRARALLEAERRALADDRILFREEKADLQRKEEELRKRVTWVETREKDLEAKLHQPPPPPPKRSSYSPFELARNLFSLKRAS